MSHSVHRALLSCASVLCLLPLGTARADDTITTDRPDVVESSDVVGAGRFQIETSVAHERGSAAGARIRTRSNPTLLRYGLSDQCELRLETDGRLSTRGSDGSRASAWADTAVGAKWHVQDGDEDRGRPGIAWLVHADLDTGSSASRGQGTRPSLRMVAEWELPGGYAAGVMPGLFAERNDAGQRYVGGTLAVVLGKSWGDDLRSFVEVAAQRLASGRNGGNSVTVNTGMARLLSPSLQVDVAVSSGVTRQAPDFAWTLGFSAKF